ncbi:TSUP family transporter [Pseudoalteromonas sp.]|uniref:TSUP family transporter n=1 Tax=Pseudoalteromonas sp. TaxID=53249 RepID=UPI0035676D9D
MELTQLTLEILMFLFFVALIAGFLDTLAGGGGLLTVPALMISGIPPITALATNKFQSTFGTATASLMMLRNKRIHWQHIKPLMLAAFVGSVIGTIVVQFINTSALNFIIPIVILSIAIYFLLTPAETNELTKPTLSESKYKRYVIPAIGCYDGIFGPGTGSFFTLAGRSLRAQPFLQATAIAKPLNFATNFASLIVFIFAGKIMWLAGGGMVVGQFIGAWLGSHCLFKIPVNLLRYMVVFICVSMLIKFMYSLNL